MLVAGKDLRRKLKSIDCLIILLLTASKTIPAWGQGSDDIGVCLDFEAFQDLNKWSPAGKCSRTTANVPVQRESVGVLYWGSVAMAAYQRGPYFAPDWQQDKLWKMLLYIGINDNNTWLFVPAINSWTLLYLETQPPGRSHYTLTTICNTSIVLFGGKWTDTIFHARIFNDTWLFSGLTETWEKQSVQLWTNEKFVSPRYVHTAVAVRQPLSNCTCQESILVFGGITDKGGVKTCLDDLWELRCIAYSNGTEQFYWIPLLKEHHNDWPQLRYHYNAVDFNRHLMYMWGGSSCINEVLLQDLWKYNLTSRVWSRVQVETPLPRSVWLSRVLTFFYHPLHGIVMLTDKNMYVLQYSHGSAQVRVMHDNRNDWPFHQFPITTWTVAGNSIFYFGFSSSEKTVKVWRIKYVNETGFWEWIPMPTPQQSPVGNKFSNRGGDFVGTSFYIAREEHWEVEIGQGFSCLWQFDIVEKLWSELCSPFAPLLYFQRTSSPINNSLLVSYTPNPWSAPPVVRRNMHVDITDLWVFETAIRRWVLCLAVSDQGDVPLSRYSSTMVEMGNGSLLMFGGRTYWGDQLFNDVWRVDVCEQSDYVPVRENCVRWVLLSRNNSNSTSVFPPARHSHAAFAFNGSLFVFGGTIEGIRSDSKQYSGVNQLSDMWQFKTDQRTWTQVNQKGLIPLLQCLTYWKMARWETKVVVVSNGSRHDDVIHCQQNSSTIFDVKTLTWSPLVTPPVIPEVIAFWNGSLVAMGWSPVPFVHNYDDGIYSDKFLYTRKFSFFKPACQSGQYSMSWKNDSCKNCLVGSFAAMGATSCSPCPEGLTTYTVMPKSLSDCVCREDYCHSGKCITTGDNLNVKSAVCQCSVGYTGTTCKYPTYFLVSGAVALVMILIFLLILFVMRMLNYRRAKKDVEEELSSAHRVWTIHCDELKLENRIDGETPGSYGEVFRAIYRDMTVAVKHLNAIMLTDQTIRKEFEREVEIMRAVRHPNIVMFFGAGTVEKETNGEKISYPFLVIEFMSRGTLKKILDSQQIHLSYKDKVAFALDVARGMRYLHSLCPPRIHRDMKSANVLVSQSWVIKVADFGSSRVVRKEGERQPTDVSGSHPLRYAKDVPLLKADSLLTRDTGTILWRPPEIFALGDYGTSADVYSYGIVLWELLCREDPYKDHEFGWIEDVSRTVQSGIRPTIPPSSPPLYVGLMEDCWQTNPEARPTFIQIVDRLVAMTHVNHDASECIGEATTRL